MAGIPSPNNDFNPLTERDWATLVRRIDDGQCTLFLGADAAFGDVPTKSQISRELAKEYDYPLDDVDNLARVTQFIATTANPLEPKEKIRDRFKSVTPPDFKSRDNPYRILAELPFSIFITTGFDSFLAPALTEAKRTPRSEICRWHPNLSELLQKFYEASLAKAVTTGNITEPALRVWFEQTLITIAGTRGTVFRGEEDTCGVPNAAVDVLENQLGRHRQWSSLSLAGLVRERSG